MKIKKAAGFLLIAIGIFIIIIQPFSTTGAVIDLSNAISRIWFFVGLGMMGIGVVLLFSGRTQTGEFYTTRPLDEIMEEYGGEKDTVFVLDSSGAIDYKRDIEKLIDKYQGNVYIPRRVLEELKGDRRLMRKLRHKNIKQINPKENPGQYKILRKLARDSLEQSRKHQDYLKLRKIIGEEKVPVGISNRELSRYENMIEDEINAKLRQHGKDTTKENQMWLLKKEYRANKGDFDVLMTALKNASDKKKTEILAEDTHIRDAIRYIIKRYPKLKDRLDYIKYREYQNQEAA